MEEPQKYLQKFFGLGIDLMTQGQLVAEIFDGPELPRLCHLLLIFVSDSTLRFFLQILDELNESGLGFELVNFSTCCCKSIEAADYLMDLLEPLWSDPMKILLRFHLELRCHPC